MGDLFLFLHLEAAWSAAVISTGLAAERNPAQATIANECPMCTKMGAAKALCSSCFRIQSPDQMATGQAERSTVS